MIKIVAGVVLICVAGGAWLYLDCLNHHEQALAEQTTQSVAQARTEAKKRAAAKELFEQQINANLTGCQAAADKAHADYAALIQQAAPSKRGQVIVPKEVNEGAAFVLAAAKADCQQVHDARLKNGQ